MADLKRVLVALDAPSAGMESKAALHWVLTSFLNNERESELVLLHVLKVPDLIPTQMGKMPYRDADARYREGYKRSELARVEAFLKNYQEVCRQKKVTASYIIRWNDRQPGIRAAVEEIGATHLVMGTGSAKSRLTSILKGKSLTARVAQQAPCTVYLIDKKLQVVGSHIYSGPRLQPKPLAGPEPAQNGSGSSTPSRTSSNASAYAPIFPPSPSSTYTSSLPASPNNPPPLPSWPTPTPSAPAFPLGGSPSPSYSAGSTPPYGTPPGLLDLNSGSYNRLSQAFQQAWGEAQQNWTQGNGHNTPNGQSVSPLPSPSRLQNGVSPSGFQNGLHRSQDTQRAYLPQNGRTDSNGHFASRANEYRRDFSGPQDWVNGQGQHMSGYVPNIEEYEGRQGDRSAGSGTPSSSAQPGTSGQNNELADMLRKLQVAEEAQASLQAKQAETERLLHEARSRAHSAESLAEAESARAHAAHQERELAKQESALAALRELEARGKERAAQEAAERERQERVVERQQAAEHYKTLLERQRRQKQYRTYSFRELEAATDSFSPAMLLGEGGFGHVYLGRLEHTPAAVKVLNPEGLQGPEEFQKEVEILSGLRHPHIVMLMGCCPEKGCLVYEYCANGSLEDRLACKDNSAPLPWYTRVRIAFEIAISLLYMHKSQSPIIHKDLKPSNILLDQNLTSKLGDVGIASVAPELAGTLVGMTSSRRGPAQTSLFHATPQGTPMYMDPEYQRSGTFNQKSDVYAFGICLLQLLVNKPPLGIIGAVEDAVEDGKLMEIVDRTAGNWPAEVARTVADLGLRCSQTRRRDRPDLETVVLPELEATRNVAMEAAAREASQGVNQGVNPGATGEDVVPSIFLCPISHDIMEDPVVAADGNTYERSEISQWFARKRTSPLTNAPVDNVRLTPNLSIRSAIKEWQEGHRHTQPWGLTLSHG